MFRLTLTVAWVMLSWSTASAQWLLQKSQTAADLRGIDSIGKGIAWASGTNGTVLRTTDAGENWETCVKPPDAEHLDFRSIQAFDAHTAIAMSSGKGDLSRLYKTTDACRSWRLVLTNPDHDGFWDALKFKPGKKTTSIRWGVLYGDPVGGKFVEFYTNDFGESWRRSLELASAHAGETLFAASNSSLLDGPAGTLIVTGGSSGSRSRTKQYNFQHDPYVPYRFVGGEIPLARSETAGAFSVATSLTDEVTFPMQGKWVGGVYGNPVTLVAVGGDSQRPVVSKGTAAFTSDGGRHWIASRNPPHGYRSAVAYDAVTKTWIAVGPNGTDISSDDGLSWRSLRPDPAMQEPDDADRNWNAISLPFVVGPQGRIGKLRASVLQQ
jgi:photosystem II stability/assembly factor-like uncharacterized protein